MDNLQDLLPILVPVAILQLVLMIVALVHVLRHDKYRFGNRAMWILIVVFINIIGPVVYFVFGRSDEA